MLPEYLHHFCCGTTCIQTVFAERAVRRCREFLPLLFLTMITWETGYDNTIYRLNFCTYIRRVITVTKYIFVTGGVVSSLGKGITAASLGRLLKNRGLKVTIQKFDPYINIDPGR